ncbi:MAG: methylated-DNA--[protein]-cysteine S-methyltransferase [Rickettsiales bacterium]|nr:MAG: methylated-DNA--[protein]-cysteine S-methyltransferase [Rickettsiales bacterium]
MYYCSPISNLLITATPDAITGIKFVEKCEVNNSNLPILKQCVKELDEYFAGKRKVFDVCVRFEGTDFQKQVWNELRKIEYGSVCSYKDIANKIGNSKGYRAVGNANGKNPIPIIVPCHRVITSDGKLGGYSGGIEIKRKLLKNEKIDL